MPLPCTTSMDVDCGSGRHDVGLDGDDPGIFERTAKYYRESASTAQR